MIALFYEILINNAVRLHIYCCMQNLHTVYDIHIYEVVTHMNKFHNIGISKIVSISIRIEIKHYVNGQWYVEKKLIVEWISNSHPHSYSYTHTFTHRIKSNAWNDSLYAGCCLRMELFVYAPFKRYSLSPVAIHHAYNNNGYDSVLYWVVCSLTLVQTKSK